MSTRAELIDGSPALRSRRWSDEQAARFHADGRWRDGCDPLLAGYAATSADRSAATDSKGSLMRGELHRGAPAALRR